MPCRNCDTELREGARFCDQCGTPVIPIAPPQAQRPEKRQATILNLDVVQSTSLVLRLGTEDGHLVMREIIRTIQDVVYRYKPRSDDRYDRIEGDSTMFCFGLPRASEDDAERAARAGLEAAEAIGKLRLRPDVVVRIRVGIATGEVLVEEHPDSLTTDKPIITGHAANLAARLRGLASPGGVVISEPTAQLIERDFDVDSLGLQFLEGVGDVPAWRLVGPRGGNRLETLMQRNARVPLVGRGQEITQLLDLWRLSRQGLGQIVLLSGEPGVGKSRLLGELYARVGDSCGAALHYQCYPYYRNSAFHPVIDHFHRWLSRIAASPDANPLDTLRVRVVEKLGLTETSFAAIASVLSPPARAEHQDADASSRWRREAIDALIDLAHARITLAGSGMMVLEDIQWSDPSTLQIVETLIARVKSWPVLIVLTLRPEFTVPPWSGSPTTEIHLGRLDPVQSTELVRRIVPDDAALSDPVITRIVEKTDGIPLFIEEFTRAALEDPQLRAQLESDATPSSAFPIPVTLSDLITARLDRSPQAKAVAQVGAVIGREFTEAMLAGVSALSDADRRRGLEDLREAGLLFSRRTQSGTTHTFKHALIQDKARDSLLRGERQDLHARVAKSLEAQAIEGMAVPPELLAHHYSEAGLPERAVRYWVRAGENALRRTANWEAIQQYRRALGAVKSYPTGSERAQLELEILEGLSGAQIALSGYAAPEVEEIIEQAQELGLEHADDEEAFKILWKEGQLLMVKAQYRPALEHCLGLARRAEREGNRRRIGFAQLLVGGSHLYLGQLPLARFYLQACTTDTEDFVPPPDLRTPAHAYLARTLWFLGYPDQALHHAVEAETLAARSPETLHPAQASGMRLLAHQLRGDVAETRRQIETTLSLASQRNQPYWTILARIVDEWLAITSGERTDITRFRSAFADYVATGARLGTTSFLVMQAEALSSIGALDEASRSIDEAFAFARDYSEEYFLPELHRQRGRILLALGGPDAARRAEPSFRRAIDVAQRQSALSWQLRSAIDLAALWRRIGREAEAASLLGTIYSQFTEGLETADLIEARRLLAMSPDEAAPTRTER